MAKLQFFLKLIPPRPTFLQDMTPEEGALMRAHVAYMKPHFDAGRALLYGPVMGGPEGGFGMGVFQVDSEVELRSILDADPTVVAGLNTYQLLPMRVGEAQSRAAAKTPGWPTLSSALFYEDPAAAIGFLERAFGFVARMRIDGEDGGIVHSELTYGDAVVMVAGVHRPGDAEPKGASPRRLGGLNTQSLFLYVDNVDAHCATAREAGARILREPADTDYGPGYWADRGYEAEDPEGHRWWFAHRVRTG